MVAYHFARSREWNDLGTRVRRTVRDVSIHSSPLCSGPSVAGCQTPRYQKQALAATSAATTSFRRRQSCSFPRFESAGHRAHVFVAHLLQAFGCERGAAAAAAMRDDYCIRIGDFLFDIELERAAAEMNRVRNVFLIPFILVPYIDNHRAVVLQLRGGFFRRTAGDVLLPFCH